MGLGLRKVLGDSGTAWGWLLGPAFESDYGPACDRVIDSAGREVREFSRVWGRGLSPPNPVAVGHVVSVPCGWWDIAGVDGGSFILPWFQDLGCGEG